MKNKMPSPSVLLDIILNGRFLCQLVYKERGNLEWINGKLAFVIADVDIQHFVERQRPSLRGKSYHIEFSNQRVI